MLIETRKIHLIQQMLKVENEEMLSKLESVLKGTGSKKAKKPSARDFVGLISDEDTLLMTKAIEEGCEQVDPDGWK